MDRSDIQTDIRTNNTGAAFQFTETYSGPGLQIKQLSREQRKFNP